MHSRAATDHTVGVKGRPGIGAKAPFAGAAALVTVALVAAAFATVAVVTSLALFVAGPTPPAVAASHCPPSCPPPTVTIPPVTTPPSTAPPTTSPPLTNPPPNSTPAPTPQTTPKVTSPAHTTSPVTSRRLSPGNVVPLAPATTVATTSTTTTTIAAIGGRLPPAPVTLPLTTKGANAHVKPLFAWLSGIGFLVALLVILGRFLTSRPKRTRARAGGGV
jgi:hypothetical protein